MSRSEEHTASYCLREQVSRVFHNKFMEFTFSIILILFIIYNPIINPVEVMHPPYFSWCWQGSPTPTVSPQSREEKHLSSHSGAFPGVHWGARG